MFGVYDATMRMQLQSSHESFKDFVNAAALSETEDPDAPLMIIRVEANIEKGPKAHRRFTYAKDKSPPSDDTVLDTLGKVLKATEGEYATDLNQKFQGLHERRVQKDVVVQTHETWTKELRDLNSRMLADAQKAQNRYQDIAIIEEDAHIAKAVRRLFKIEFLQHPLKHKAAELLTVIDSESYEKSFKFFKDTLRKVEAKDATESSLGVLFEEVKQHIATKKQELGTKAPIILKEITLLVEELFRYIAFAALSRRESLPEESQERAHLQRLEEQATAEALKHALPIPQHAIPAWSQEFIAAFIKRAKSESLESYDKFRGGQIGATAPLVGPYRNISPEISELTSIAKALQEFVKLIQARIRVCCKGSLMTCFATLEDELGQYKQLLAFIELEIHKQRRALSEIAFTPSVRAGWSYVAKQFAKLAEARTYLQDFALLATGSMKPSVRALLDTIQYLKVRSITHLLNATKAVCSLVDPAKNKRFHDRIQRLSTEVLQDILSVTGRKTLELTESEKQVPNSIYRRTPFPHGENSLRAPALPEDVLHYLEKRLIAHLYYSDEKSEDTECETVIHILSTDPLYSKAFSDACYHNETLKVLLREYDEQKTISHEELQAITDVLSCLATTNGKKEAVFRYVQAKVLLKNINSSRIGWLTRRLETSFTLIEESLQLPAYSKSATLVLTEKPLYGLQDEEKDAALYNALALSLYDEDANATAKLIEYAKHTHVDDLPAEDSPLRLLFDKWLLEQFAEGSYSGRLELLDKLFKEYIQQPKEREFWRRQVGMATMEFALLQYVSLQPEANVRMDVLVDVKRGTFGKELWKAIIPLAYRAQKALKQEKERLLLEAQAIYVKSRQELPKALPDTVTNNNIVSWCLLNGFR